MKKQVMAQICAVVLVAAAVLFGVKGVLDARQSSAEPVQTEAPTQTAEPAQSTAESALPEPVPQGRKVNMDDAMWEDAINELDEYSDQQIGGN